ncbi:MAG: DUF5676 family membrane protein [Sphingomonadales bacterium]|jgi:CDP-diglyceride synthetase
MKIDELAFAKALALTSAILWIICAAIVAVLPDMMMSMTGDMMHMDLSDRAWALDWTGFLIGLVLWSVIAGIFGWLIASFYNRFNKSA